MLKASALYIVIIIALVIGLLCSSLIVAAYYYRAEYQKKFRYDQLVDNVGSGVNILLTSGDTAYIKEKVFSLFNKETDSVALRHVFWGLYDMGVARAFIQKDTLLRIFSFASTIDSAKWAVLYLMNEERPFSLSGKTTIRGDAFIPEAGVKEAYIDNKAYQGDKRLIIGSKHFSEKKLPELNGGRLNQFEQMITGGHPADSVLTGPDSIRRSFLLPTRWVNFKKTPQILQNRYLDGNLILLSDTSITIDSTTVLHNVLIFAKTITVKAGFKGNAQLFATDSIRIDSNCRLDYPSGLGILRFHSPKVASQARITLGKNTVVNGIIFTWEKEKTDLKPLIRIEKRGRVHGQVYSQGVLELQDGTEIDGSVFTSRFLYKSAFTLYENYLINTTLDSRALSPYYLTSDLLPVAKKRKKVLQWLMAK